MTAIYFRWSDLADRPSSDWPDRCSRFQPFRLL